MHKFIVVFLVIWRKQKVEKYLPKTERFLIKMTSIKPAMLVSSLVLPTLNTAQYRQSIHMPYPVVSFLGAHRTRIQNMCTFPFGMCHFFYVENSLLRFFVYVCLCTRTHVEVFIAAITAKRRLFIFIAMCFFQLESSFLSLSRNFSVFLFVSRRKCQ